MLGDEQHLQRGSRNDPAYRDRHGTWLLRSTSDTREHRRELRKGRIDRRLLRTRSLRTQLIALGPREDGAPRPMKMGTIASLWRYDVGACGTLPQLKMRRPAILQYTPSPRLRPRPAVAVHSRLRSRAGPLP